MKITTEHSASSYGIPVILDDKGEVMDYADGIRTLRASLGLTARELGELVGVGERAVNGWEYGRLPGAAALNALAQVLKNNRKVVKAK